MIKIATLKKTLMSIILILGLVLTSFAFCACDGDDDAQTIKVEGTVLTQGTQTLQILSREQPPMGDDPASFKSTITKEDIVLSGVLSTRTVDSVVFESESSILVTISGNAKAFTGNETNAYIHIKKRALNNDIDAFDYISVHKPHANVDEAGSMGSTASGYTVSATISLHGGEFIDKDQIEFLENVGGALSIASLSDGKLYLEFTGIPEITSKPEIRINAGATSLNKTMLLTVAIGAKGYVQD